MRQQANFLAPLSWLSLDVVIGAMATLYFFQELLHVHLAWPAYGLLALAVWTLYTGDHLLDARKSKGPLSPRRAFHLRYQVYLAAGVFLALVGGGWAAWTWFGWGKELQLTLVLVASMGGCRWAIQKFGPIVLKEVSIALFYVVGSLWLPMLRSEVKDLSWQALAFAVVFFLVALLNLWMLSFLDREEDRKDGFISIAMLLPPIKIVQWIRKLAFLGIFIAMASFILLPSFYRPFSCVLLLMVLVHYLTFFQSGATAIQKRQRMELAFWIPWVLLLL
jgi:hypothetical protein